MVANSKQIDEAELVGGAKVKGKTPKARKVALGLIGLVAAAGVTLYVTGIGRESTDDAQVEGHIISVGARVGGQVIEVLAKDNQLVEAGTALVKLDPVETDARLAAASADLAAANANVKAAQAQLAITEANAEANLRQAKGGLTTASSGLSASRAALDQARADAAAARSRLKLADLDLQRVKKLRTDGVVSLGELDAKQAGYDQAKAAVDQSEARLASAKVGIDGSSGGIETAEGRLASANTATAQVDAAHAAVDLALARVDQAAAAKHLAELNASYVEIKAPQRGIVSRRTVESGQVVGVGTPLLALVPVDDVWIVANFKEDQLKDMRPGQKAHVRVDSFGRREFDGVVDSVAGATGSKFALLPPDNASGNFVKVVQRVPVLVRLDAKDHAGLALRPGMSADVTVVTAAPKAGDKK